MAKKKKKVKKIGTMDIILIFIGLVLLAFTVEILIIFKDTGCEPNTLITCVFAALAGECGVMGWIKTTKEKNKEREWEKEDRKGKKENEE